MNRIDRAIGILLMLRTGKTISAQSLAARYEVSTRTVYRDVEVLAELGIPVYAEMGRNGGFRLVDGYFMPPVMFDFREALAVMLGLRFLKGLRAPPFAQEIETTEAKLLAAMPDASRAQLARADELIGLEKIPPDLLHPERDDPQTRPGLDGAAEGRLVGEFLSAVVEQRALELTYRAMDADAERPVALMPLAVIWDRERWYLVGQRLGPRGGTRTLRADRVRDCKPAPRPMQAVPPLDVRSLLDRQWLGTAMAQWARQAPVRVRLSAARARLLMADWYYRHAVFEADRAGNGGVVMTVGEDDAQWVLPLVRWLGPEAELLEPAAWRAALRAELKTMERCHR